MTFKQFKEMFLGGTICNIDYPGIDVSTIIKIRRYYDEGVSEIRIYDNDPYDSIYPWGIPFVFIKKLEPNIIEFIYDNCIKVTANKNNIRMKKLDRL